MTYQQRRLRVHYLVRGAKLVRCGLEGAQRTTHNAEQLTCERCLHCLDADKRKAG